MLLAGLATPLVVSVHTIVAFDFTIAILPGWHSTIFPPYFVAGAIFSGFAMVITLAIPLRAALWTADIHHRPAPATTWPRSLLATGLIVAYGYMMEAFMAWYGHNPYEKFVQLQNRPFGPYAHTYWMLIACNVSSAVPLVHWVRANPVVLWFIAIVVNIGMWLERYVIVVTSLHRDFLPSSWGMYHGTVWDYATFYGTLGLFFALFFLFIRFLPVISIAEMRELVHEEQQEQRAASGVGKPPRGHVMSAKSEQPEVYGLMAEFDDPGLLIEATQHAYDRGYRMMEAYTPFPVEGLADALGFHRNKLPRVVLIGGLARRNWRFFHAVVFGRDHYPINVGGRPFNSWPAFIPITFEMTILGRPYRRCSACWPSTGCRGRTIRFSTCRVSYWRRATGSSSAFRLATLCSRSNRASRFLEEHHPKAISVVPA